MFNTIVVGVSTQPCSDTVSISEKIQKGYHYMVNINVAIQ